MAPVGPILQTVLLVLLQCLAGFVLAYKGILDKPMQKKLNSLNVALFEPALLFSNVAFFLTPDKLRDLWIIPINFVVVTGVSWLIAYSVARFLHLKPSQRHFAMAASIFMNSVSVPAALMRTLVDFVSALKLNEDDEDAMFSRALTYLMLYSTCGMLVRWSLGVKLLSRASPDANTGAGASEGTSREASLKARRRREPMGETNERTPLLLSDSESSSTAPSTSSKHVSDTETSTPSTPRGTVSPPRVRFILAEEGVDGGSAHIHVAYPGEEMTTKPGKGWVREDSVFRKHMWDDDDDHDDDDDDHERATAARVVLRPHSASLKRRICTLLRKLPPLLAKTPAPLAAAIISLLVALIPPLQSVLADHAKPVRGALDAAGACWVPLTLVALGAYFYQPRGENKKSDVGSSGGGGPDVGEAGLLPRWWNWSRAEAHEESGVSSPLPRAMGALGTAVEKRPRSASTSCNASTSTLNSQISRTGGRTGDGRTVAVAVFVRMLLVPAALLPLLALAVRLSKGRVGVLDDPVFIVATALLVSAPPALTLTQMMQAASGDTLEALVSRTMFWAYCIATPPATVAYVVLGLVLVRLE